MPTPKPDCPPILEGTFDWTEYRVLAVGVGVVHFVTTRRRNGSVVLRTQQCTMVLVLISRIDHEYD